MTEVVKLGTVLRGIQAGKSFQTAEVLARPDELGVLKVSAVTWSDFQPDEAKALVGTYDPQESHKVKSGDLLISRANTKEFVGAVVLVGQDYPLRLLSDKTLRLVLDETRVSKEFLLFALRSALAREHIEHFATGTSDSMRNISQGVIESIPITLPGLKTQRRIAIRLKAQLAEIESSFLAAQAQLLDVRALHASILRDAFKEVIPIALPKSRGVPPSGWCWHELCEIAKLESGHTPSRLRPDWWSGDVSWVSLTEIRGLDGKWVEETHLRTNEAGIANSSARILPRGTVCFSRTASIGFVTIMAKPMATSQDFANWVCGDELDPEFLMYALIRSRSELRAIATGATHKTIYMPELESFQICAPERSEQERIVVALKKRLATREVMRSALQHQYQEIKRMPQSVLAQAFEF